MINKELIQYIAHKALAIRIGSLRATTAAGTGHPTSCLSAADMVAALYSSVLRYDYQDPKNQNNDRFILSKGHAVPCIYAALYSIGVITEQQLLSYRKLDSPFEGHPTPRLAFNEAATGSLGQGLAVGVGMALNARYNKLSYRTYVMMGDGEIAEGSVWEAAELAAYYNLDNLIGIVDCNRLGQSTTSLHAHEVERYAKKFEAFGWKTFIIDGHDIAQILQTIQLAHATKGQPTMIIAKTLKGYGLEGIEDLNGYHGKPFKKDELPVMIKRLEERFVSAQSFTSSQDFAPAKPELLSHNQKTQTSTISIDLAQDSNAGSFAMGRSISTRKAFGHALVALGKASDKVFAVDGDVKNSTFTEMFEKEYPNRFIQCFIAEQNMIGVSTGLVLRGNIPFASTFASFFSRCYDQVRMAGIGRAALRLCGSHSGVSIGQDGPSQMGLEDISMMRAIPESVVLWPSDAVCAYKLVELMSNYGNGVSYMKSTRADTPVLYPLEEHFSIGGSKVLRSSGSDKACIISAGITLHEALKAYDSLKEQGISVSVIDLYSIKPLDSATIKRIAQKSGNLIITVEDHYIQGGLGEAVAAEMVNEKVAMHMLAVRQLPRSGQPEELLEYEGIDAKSIVQAVIKAL